MNPQTRPIIQSVGKGLGFTTTQVASAALGQVAFGGSETGEILRIAEETFFYFAVDTLEIADYAYLISHGEVVMVRHG